MKIVRPNAVYLDASAMTPYELIEKAGRICYKSEDRITEGSAAKFVGNLAKNGHWAMLEHAYLYVRMSPAAQEEISRIAGRDRTLLAYINTEGEFLSASFRAIAELFRAVPPSGYNHVFEGFRFLLQSRYPEALGEWQPFWYGSTEELAEKEADEWTLMDREEFTEGMSGDREGLMKCLPHTIAFTADRGVTHELVRHRPASFAQESTRYCSYDKGRFGSEITVVEPWWAKDGGADADGNPTEQYRTWLSAMEAAEQAYFHLTGDLGLPAQLARAVLPQSVKADIVVTATEKEWQHIIDLRLTGTTGAPHPDMRRVMGLAAPLLIEHSCGRLSDEAPEE